MGAAREMVVAVLVVAGTLTGMVQFSGEVFSSYDDDVQSSSTFSQVKKAAGETRASTSDQVNESSKRFEEIKASGDTGIIESAVVGSKSLLDGLRTTVVSVGAALNLVTLSSRILRLPTWFQNMVAGILIIIVVFAGLSARQGWDV